jgi:hypothetical protein
MKRKDIKDGCLVIDRWYIEYGTGKITNVKKTVFNVIFNDKIIKYDYPHAQFLDKVK